MCRVRGSSTVGGSVGGPVSGGGPRRSQSSWPFRVRVRVRASVLIGPPAASMNLDTSFGTGVFPRTSASKSIPRKQGCALSPPMPLFPLEPPSRIAGRGCKKAFTALEASSLKLPRGTESESRPNGCWGGEAVYSM